MTCWDLTNYCVYLYLLQFEKFRHVSKITTKLASLASDVSGAAFTSRCDLLEQLSCLWEHGKKAAVMEGTESQP